MRRSVSALIVLATACATAGCAVVRPTLDARATGWPDAPATSWTPTADALPGASGGSGSGGRAPSARAASPALGASASASGSVGGSTDATRVDKPGLSIPLPSGYSDVTAQVTDAPTAGSTRLVALLRNSAQHLIVVQSVSTDRASVEEFAGYYITALEAAGQTEVTGRRTVEVAGLPGEELSLRSSATGEPSVLYLAMRSSGNVVWVSGKTPTDADRQAIRDVAEGLTLR